MSRYKVNIHCIGILIMSSVYHGSEYERLHIFFWLLKDCGWNTLNKPTWYLGLVPTLTMAIDFAWIVANVNVCFMKYCDVVQSFKFKYSRG